MVIGLEQTQYTVEEEEDRVVLVEVCANLTRGSLERDAEVILRTVDGSAVGKDAHVTVWLDNYSLHCFL